MLGGVPVSTHARSPYGLHMMKGKGDTGDESKSPRISVLSSPMSCMPHDMLEKHLSTGYTDGLIFFTLIYFFLE